VLVALVILLLHHPGLDHPDRHHPVSLIGTFAMMALAASP
jgi:hypothetical protein